MNRYTHDGKETLYVFRGILGDRTTLTVKTDNYNYALYKAQRFFDKTPHQLVLTEEL